MEIKDILSEEMLKIEKEKITALNASKAFLLIKSMIIETTEDAFLYLSCINLLNAYVKKEYVNKLFAKNYYHKHFVQTVVDAVIQNKIENVTFYKEESNLLMVNVNGVQFSFHSVKLSDIMQAESKGRSKIYKKQKWAGVRLQPIANSIFEKALNLNNLSKKTYVGNTTTELLKEIEMQNELSKVNVA